MESTTGWYMYDPVTSTLPPIKLARSTGVARCINRLTGRIRGQGSVLVYLRFFLWRQIGFVVFQPRQFLIENLRNQSEQIIDL